MRYICIAIAWGLAAVTVISSPALADPAKSELASVELEGFRVAAVGYWPAPADEFGCNSYLFTAEGMPPAGNVFISLMDAETAAPISLVAPPGSGEALRSGSFRVCGQPGQRVAASLQLRISVMGGHLADSAPFTWGGTPPVVTGLPEGLGNVAIGETSVATRGPWLAPRAGKCVNLQLAGTVAPEPSVAYVIDAESRRVLGSGPVIAGVAAESAAGSVMVCRAEGSPAIRAIALQLATPLHFAEGDPFTWSASAPPPGPGAVLPFTVTSGEVTVSSVGLWPAPVSAESSSAEGGGFSYLVDYSGVPAGSTTFVDLIDSQTREVVAGTVIYSPADLPAAPSGRASVGAKSGGPLRPFLVQVLVSAGSTNSSIAEAGPFAWEPAPSSPPPGTLPPASVSLGPLVATTQGDWTVPAVGENRTVRLTGVPQGTLIFVDLVDATTREVISSAQFYDPESDSGSVSLPITTPMTGQSRVAVQLFAQTYGFAESKTLRWVTPPTVPSEPRGAAASLDSGGTSATITWEAPSFDGDAAITQYVVVSEPSMPGCTWVSGPLQCQVSGLQGGTTYTFAVYAVNAVGRSGPSATATLVVPAPPVRPGAVRALSAKATSGKGRILVTWKAPSTDGGLPIAGYQYRVGQTAWKSTTVQRVTVSGLRSKREIMVSVRAVNAVGHGPTVSVRGTPR